MHPGKGQLGEDQNHHQRPENKCTHTIFTNVEVIRYPLSVMSYQLSGEILSAIFTDNR
jgi:hypothetical protein